MKVGSHPELFWQPWMAHLFPGIGPSDMHGLYLHQVSGMREFLQARVKAGKR